MTANDDREILRFKLRQWGRRRRSLEAERDQLVRQALAAEITIEEIHQSTGLGRTTVDRIGKAEAA